MKVREHSKQQTQRSKDALLAHTQMVFALKRIQKLAKQDLEKKRVALALDFTRHRPLYYRLNEDKSVSPIFGTLANGDDATMQWARSFEKFENRVVQQDDVDGRLVSTVFLGLDHSSGFGGPPLIFETMVFSKETKTFTHAGRTREYHEELDQRRYSTWDQAVAGHAEALAATRAIAAKIDGTTKPGASE